MVQGRCSVHSVWWSPCSVRRDLRTEHARSSTPGPQDSSSTPRRTRAANDNGFTPVWADEEACFSFVVEDDALAFVEFEVYDRADVL